MVRVKWRLLWILLPVLLTGVAWQWWARDQGGVGDACGGKRFGVETVSGGAAPYIALTANARTGLFLLDYGSTQSSLAADVFDPGGTKAEPFVTSFSLPTFPKGRFRLAKYLSPRSPKGGQIGVVGTDFLSRLTAVLSLGPEGGSVVFDAKPCDGDRLRAHGMMPIRQSGFFSADPRRIANTRPNVPIVFVRIGDVTTWAQIDTGYDDLEMQPSIDINEALYQKLAATNVAIGDKGVISVSTCSGLETRPVYTAADVVIVSEAGLPLRDLGPVTLVRKAASGCGGIGNLSEPAAQIAASIVVRLGDMVIDPYAELVWVGRGE